MNAGIIRSAGVRYDRRVARSFVYRGGSLTVMLREGRPELEGVTLLTLVRWVQGIGPRKAERILLGLPHHYPLGDLNPAERQLLTERLAAAERAIYVRKTTYHQED